jgi:RHS repeat-associated protein
LGESPFVELRTAGGSDVWVEDFEARFKDRALKSEIEGQEVSQLLARDSFEGYPEGRFPSTGGWRLNADTQGLSGQVLPDAQVGPSRRRVDPQRASQGRLSTDTVKRAREESTNGIQERTDRGPAPEKRETYVDGTDSVTGLKSLVFSGDEPVEIILIKQLELPATAPFGVSEGNFAIGEAPESTSGIALSRSRVLARLRRDDDKGRTRRKDESALGNGTHQPEEPAYSPRTLASGSASSASGKSTKLMSASPVGNYYIYSFDGRLLQVYDVYGALQKDFIYMGSRLVAEYDHVNTRLLYFTPDQINSTRVVTDGVGNVVYTAIYDPYGNVRTETGSVDPMPQFSGKERDAESQLDYFGARYYDRSQYRFISADPRVAPADSSAGQQHCNLYSYCLNNPILGMDPDGRDTIISVFRTDSSSASTTGIMFVCDKSLFPTKVIGETWELPYKNNAENISCIEPGVYAAHLRFRENLGYDVIELENRHGRTGVQIHPKGRKNEGCITLKKPSDFWKLMRTVGLVPFYGPNGEMDVSPYEPIVVCVFWWDFPKIPEPIPVVSYEYKVTGYK